MRLLYVILLACCVPTLSVAEPSSRIFYTEQYPPLSYSHNGNVEGLAPDLVRALLRRLDEHAYFKVQPWSRALQQVQTQPNSALFVTVRNPEREAGFKWVGPILLTHDGFYSLRDSHIRVSSLAELRHAGDIALPRGWYYSTQLAREQIDNLVWVNEPEQMYEMLHHQRVEMILTDLIGFYPVAKHPHLNARLSLDQVKLVYPFNTSHGYIAFHPDTEDAVIQRWQQALDEMKADGSFSQIYQRWLPGQPEPD